jgi:hypothetical protein
MIHHTPMCISPSHLIQLLRHRIVAQNRVPIPRQSLVNAGFVSGRMSWNRDGGEEVVQIWVAPFQSRRGVESIDIEALPSRPIRV